MEPELRVLTSTQIKYLYDTDLIRTFPTAELMPFAKMITLTSQGAYDMQGYFEGDTLLGYAMLCVDGTHDYALIDYLGILTELRNSGMGKKLLTLVERHCSTYRGVLAEVEAPTGRSTAEDTTIMRRLSFYKRAGFVRLPYDMSLFGVRYRTLVYPLSGAVPSERVLMAHQRLYHEQFNSAQYERYVQLPLGKEPLRPFSPWAEG